jgi:hypothetical protein
MRFSISTIVAVFAAAAMAAPSTAAGTTSVVNRDTSAVNALQAQAQTFLAAKEAAGCSRISKSSTNNHMALHQQASQGASLLLLLLSFLALLRSPRLD